ncbi:MAG: hypothetical protein ACO395_07570 [Pontimonas sp.]
MYSIIVRGTTNSHWWLEEAKNNAAAVAAYASIVAETIASQDAFEGTITLNIIAPDGTAHIMRSVTFG